jgi:hypothetical protein
MTNAAVLKRNQKANWVSVFACLTFGMLSHNRATIAETSKSARKYNLARLIIGIDFTI